MDRSLPVASVEGQKDLAPEAEWNLSVPAAGPAYFPGPPIPAAKRQMAAELETYYRWRSWAFTFGNGRAFGCGRL